MQGSPTTRKRPLPASSTGIVKPASKRTPINYTSHRSSSAAVFRAATRTTNTARTNTARTRTATRTQTARYEDAFVIAVIDNNVKDVGLCAYNLSGFDVELRQFSDSNTYAKLLTMLCVFAPVEIILSLSSAGGLLDQAIQACPHLTNVKVCSKILRFFLL